MVKMKIAEAIDGKSIVLVPVGTAGSAFNKLDVNKLVDAFTEEQSPPAPTSAPAKTEP